MKKVLFFIAVISLMFSACKQNEYEANLNKMSELAKQHFDNLAFKENSSIEYLSFDAIKYDTVTNDSYYGKLLSAYDAEGDRHYEIAKKYKLEVEHEINLAKLAQLAGNKQGILEAKKDADAIQEKIKKEIELIKSIHSKIDSLINLSESDGEDGIWYEMKLFMKATVSDNHGNTTNILDTLHTLFNNNFDIVTTPNVRVDIKD